MRPEIKPDTNIVLVGMPGVGKSTVGVLLAKITSHGFVDTDVYIQSRERRRLQEILDAEGRDAFCRLEEEHALSLDCSRCVIATGGSLIYSDAAMQHLKSRGVVVHLDLAVAQLKKRKSAWQTSPPAGWSWRPTRTWKTCTRSGCRYTGSTRM
jgi:shikimate kinase